MAGVFISYRRADAGGWAGRLKDHLEMRFGNTLVWQDVDDLEYGKDYLPQILQAIESSDAVLIIIGPHWLKDGRKRLQDPKDVLRTEIARALKSKAAVIPVLVGGAQMPPAADLPRPIARLVDRHGTTISDSDWGRGVQMLIEQLRQLVLASGKPQPLSELHAKLDNMQEQYFALLERDAAQAADVARNALAFLDEQMPSYPQDIYLQMFRGYFLKNAAMAARDLGDQDGFESSLLKADQIFKTIRSEGETHLANAYTGLGSVVFLKGDPKEALRLIDKALELMPEHVYAQQDRKAVLEFLKSKPKARRH